MSVGSELEVFHDTAIALLIGFNDVCIRIMDEGVVFNDAPVAFIVQAVRLN